ncbi:hypothetical protein RBB50_006441 [Rhinocladiella similis]
MIVNFALRNAGKAVEGSSEQLFGPLGSAVTYVLGFGKQVLRVSVTNFHEWITSITSQLLLGSSSSRHDRCASVVTLAVFKNHILVSPSNDPQHQPTLQLLSRIYQPSFQHLTLRAPEAAGVGLAPRLSTAKQLRGVPALMHSETCHDGHELHCAPFLPTVAFTTEYHPMNGVQEEGGMMPNYNSGTLAVGGLVSCWETKKPPL